MMWLLDTNVVSELNARGNPVVLNWSNGVDPLLTFVSAVTILEIERGVLLRERRDPRQGTVLRAWFEAVVLDGFSGRVLAFDIDAARLTAGLHVPDPRPRYDAMIAATALAHGLTVVTRNVKDFEPLGVRVLNPWSVDQ